MDGRGAWMLHILTCAVLVVKMMVPFWIPIIIRHTYYVGYPKRDHNFDDHSSEVRELGIRALL